MNDKNLAAHAASPISDADPYGGWAGGPQLAASGFFRSEKVDGKWWSVDPKGHLFWSPGVCRVYPGLPTIFGEIPAVWVAASRHCDMLG